MCARFPFRKFACLAALGLAAISVADERREHFDHDPGWDGLNNRSEAFDIRTVVQDFGYSEASHNDAAPGEVGGLITPDGTAAYYAREMPRRSFEDAFSASGTLVVNKGAGNTLLGFFNHGTINEWRTPNSVVFRINGRGDFFHVHFEYATSRWRAGAGVIGRSDREADRVYPLEIPSDGVHTWSLAYDPAGNNGGGTIRATFDGEAAVCDLAPGHKGEGAVFDRFGLLNVIKSVDSPGELWIDNVSINGVEERFDTDPRWEGYRNRLTYESADVRPRFNFGYSATNNAGGAPGEIGGLFFRGDCREPARLAYYGDKLDVLTLDRPLRASGKVSLHRGVSDSSTLFGFFHSERSVQVNPSQSSGLPKDFLGISIEGPSSEGFYVYPVYRANNDAQGVGRYEVSPRIYPDGASHNWTLEYDPEGADGNGRLVLSMDHQSIDIALESGARGAGTQFDRFGFVTPWIDGNGQVVYFDELEYTCRQE